jgi:hypothetical protein
MLNWHGCAVSASRKGMAVRSRRFWIVCAALAAILVGADVQSRWLEQVFLAFPGIDKIAHVTFHCILFACVRAIASNSSAPPRFLTPIAVVVGLTVAALDESIQALVPSRSVEVEDLIADIAGMALGWVLTARPARAWAVAVTTAAVLVSGYVTANTYLRLRDYTRALRYEQQQDFVTARTLLQRALANGLRSAALYNELGWVEIESGVGDPAKAVEYAKTALDMEPQNADILDTYGWALHHAGRSRDALDALLAAFEKKPKIYSIHYHLGEVYLALGRTADAEAHFRQQMQLTGTREAVLARQALDQMAENR